MNRRNEPRHDMPRGGMLGCRLSAAAILVAAGAAHVRAAPQPWKRETLHEFKDTSKNEGAFPEGELVLTKAGVLYGVTSTGGNNNGDGTIYSIEVSEKKFRKVYEFQGGKDGSIPGGGLLSRPPYLYGVTRFGGHRRNGTVFRIDPTKKPENAKFTLYHFQGGNADGEDPSGGLVELKGLLYGTTVGGGEKGFGTVYYVDPRNCKEEGKCPEKVIYSFKGKPDDGKFPVAGLIYDGDRLVGTTQAGGKDDRGTVFALDPGNPDKDKLLHSFKGDPDGSQPGSAVLFDDGTLYGTTRYYGAENCEEKLGKPGCGTVFALDNEKAGPQDFIKIHQFEGRPTDGAHSEAPLIRDGGYLYGTTHNDGGTKDKPARGTVFRIKIVSHKESILFTFTGGRDGGEPAGGLMAQGGGIYYGTTEYGGDITECNSGATARGCGTVFMLTKP